MTGVRTWLQAVIAGARPIWLLGPTQDTDALAESARREGVAGLVEGRLGDAVNAQQAWALAVPIPVRNAFLDASRDAALLSMLLESETRRLLSAMDQAAIPGLLLKGQAIAQWAYPDPSLRASGDIDVLVATRDAADLLARRLCESGYEIPSPPVTGLFWR